MTTSLMSNTGWKTWKGSQDKDGFADFHITFQIEADPLDGPNNVYATPGLPTFGSTWLFGDDENDFAWCRWDVEIVPILQNETNTQWQATYHFSTRPPAANDRPCSQNQPGDPILEPMKLSGHFCKYTEEATKDRDGNPITNSAKEQIHGHVVTFDKNKPQIKIEQNVLDLQYTVLASMVDTVNNAPLWGFGVRCVKLSDIQWQRKFYGQCYVYFTRTLTFDIDVKTFDREVLDQGTMVLKGHWDISLGAFTGNWVVDNIAGKPADPSNPRHFIKFKDLSSQPAKVILDGGGKPAGLSTTSQYYLSIAGGANTLDTEGQWIPVTSATPVAWTPLQGWKRGDMVTYAVPVPLLTQPASLYVAVRDGFTLTTPDIDEQWEVVGPSPPMPASKGNWVEGTAYAQGDLVQGTTSIPAGKIKVQYYQESDFTQLGIPLDFNDISSYYG